MTDKVAEYKKLMESNFEFVRGYEMYVHGDYGIHTLLRASSLKEAHKEAKELTGGKKKYRLYEVDFAVPKESMPGKYLVK